MDGEDHRAGNPFTALEGYTVIDPGRPIPADDVDVDAEAGRVTTPEMQDLSCAFDGAVCEHHGETIQASPDGPL